MSVKQTGTTPADRADGNRTGKNVLKVAVIAAVLSLVVAGNGFGWAIGASFGIQPIGGQPSQAMVSFRLAEIPIMWGLGFEIANSFSLGLTADWWLFHERLSPAIALYIGPGLYGTIGSVFEIGARVPIGFQVYPLDVLELFLEIAPGIKIFTTRSSFAFPDFSLHGSFGVRFWF